MGKVLSVVYGNLYSPDGDAPVLGLDAEIVLKKDNTDLYPHQVGLPQQRPNGRSIWRHSYWDWHGDGFAFELCVAPSSCIETILENVGWGFANGLVKNLGKDLYVSAPVVYNIPEEVVKASPKDVVRLGCAQSFNVYQDAGQPNVLVSANNRTTGCHLHLSHPWLNNDRAKTLVQWADVFVGSAWTMISPEDPQQEAYRRTAYGRAGEHRRNYYPSRYSDLDDPFGVEYRVLPGRPLLNPVYLSLMFRLYRVAWQALFTLSPQNLETWVDAARTAINTSDKKLATQVIMDTPLDTVTKNILTELQTEPLPNLDPIRLFEEAISHQGVLQWALNRRIIDSYVN